MIHRRANKQMSTVSTDLENIAKRRKLLKDFCHNQLSHVIITDTRAKYLQKRNIFVQGAITIATEGGDISKGLFNLLQIGWAVAVNKIQNYYEKGDKKLNNPLTGAFCASLNQGILTFYNTSLSGDSLNVNDKTEAEQMIRQFQMFGAVTLGELETQEQDLIVANLEQERDTYRTLSERFEKKIQNLAQELELYKEKASTTNEK